MITPETLASLRTKIPIPQSYSLFSSCFGWCILLPWEENGSHMDVS